MKKIIFIYYLILSVTIGSKVFHTIYKNSMTIANAQDWRDLTAQKEALMEQKYALEQRLTEQISLSTVMDNLDDSYTSLSPITVINPVQKVAVK